MASLEPPTVLGGIACLLLHAWLASAAAPMGDMVNPGVFYFFASGQIAVADPSVSGILALLRQDSSVPFPNTCKGSPFEGAWGEVADGQGGRTLMSSAVYMAKAGERDANLQDGVYTLDLSTGKVAAFAPAPAGLSGSGSRLDAVSFVPLTGKVWITTSTNISSSAGRSSGTSKASMEAATATAASSLLVMGPTVAEATQLSASTLSPSATTPTATAASSVHRLLHDINLGGMAYLTVSSRSGVFALNLFPLASATPSPTPARTNASTGAVPRSSAVFISFDNIANAAGSGANKPSCPGTLHGVYSRVVRYAFFTCVDDAALALAGLSPKSASASTSKAAGNGQSGAKLGMVQLDATSNTPKKLWPFTGDKLVLTPDEAFLLVISSAQRCIYLLQLTAVQRNVTQWPALTFSVRGDYMPADVAFVAKDSRYVAYISFLNTDTIGTFDFNQLLQCGTACSAENVASFVQFQQQLGFQNPPTITDPVTGMVTTTGRIVTRVRPIAAGGGWICNAAVYDGGAVCFNPMQSATVRFNNLTSVQHIRFVPGSFVPSNGGPITDNPIYNCTTAPRSIPSPPPPFATAPAPESNAAVHGTAAHWLASTVLAASVTYLLQQCRW